jgi:DNA-binding SARP family transcriptional activator
MEFRLLGTVEVTVAGRPVDPGRPRQRTVLAALLVDAGRRVSTEALIDRVWGDAPPHHARRALHAHLARTRRMLERDGWPSPPLVRRQDGYLLDVDPDLVDVHRFRRLVVEAGGIRPGEERAARLRDALGLWRGEPVAGLRGGWAARTRQALSQQRLDATIAWADAELGCGNAAVTVGPLTELAGEQPLLEPLAAALLRSLHAAGQPAVALDHYAALRQRLADELGADPDAELQAIHRTILRGAAKLTPLTARRTLPAEVGRFVGRQEELDRLLDTVDSARYHDERTAAIHAVDGMAGIGKTAFVLHAAHRLADRFPDGQRFVELRAHAPGRTALDPATALGTLLEGDGVGAEEIPAGLSARVSLWRRRVTGSRMLLVLDDVADAQQVTPLLPHAPGCLVLVTSRRKLTAVPGVIPLSLDTLSPDDAAELFSDRAGPRARADEAAVREIVALCGFLPLAITLTAARLHAHPTWTAADLVEGLTEAEDELGEMASGGLTVAAAFELSYRGLPADRQRLFRRLALRPGTDFDARAAAGASRTGPDEARRALEDLLEHNLLTEPTRGRYRFHKLVAAYARSQCGCRSRRD